MNRLLSALCSKSVQSSASRCSTSSKFVENNLEETMISEEDISEKSLVLAKLKRKTPGYKDLVNDCLHLGYFPKEWMLGIVKTLLKASD